MNTKTSSTIGFSDMFAQMGDMGNATDSIFYHIDACSPCTYESIQAFSDNQLDNSIDVGFILERLIDSNEIEFCQSSQTYSTI